MGTDWACETARYPRPDVFSSDAFERKGRNVPGFKRSTQAPEKDCSEKRPSTSQQEPSNSIRSSESSERAVKPRKYKIHQKVRKKEGPGR
jgi:hypothetical protein